MATPREIELKLECGVADLAALANHPLLRADGTPEAVVLSSTYFDTAKGDLRKGGLTLRVRREGDRRIQTVKAASASVGLFDRAEWEAEIFGEVPDAEAFAETPVPALLGDAADPALVPVFTSVVDRTTRLVVHGASLISVTLDQGRIETAEGAVPLCEVELELDEGSPGDLFGLAQALAETIPLRLGALSKSARGWRLIDGTLRKSSKASPVRLEPGATAGEAFRAVAQACLHHLRLNEDVFLHGRHPEGLHQIRVALRRLRSALTLFKPILTSDPAAAHLRDEIKRVTEPFGRARNLDVFLETTLPAELQKRPEEAGLQDLRTRLEAERDRAHDAVIATLESPAWRSLILDVAAWIETGAWRTQGPAEGGTPARDATAEDFAADILDRIRRRIRKRGRRLERLDHEARHRVRIEGKKLRYGAEFFASLYTDKKAHKRHKAFVSAVSDLQDHLGALNDMATAHEVLSSLATAGDGVPAETLFAAGLTAGDNEAETKALLAKAADAHADLVDLKPFWR
ncbi:CYTH and CHAD domain-containing protein [Methylobacterium sp. Leaf100]|uniref:CYTH and CHAD domain-containing protein n=1 Tax=Methylobacterium sp. Leaf100 TaxID=1736252 RepID=UPI0006FAD529|nr:CYTH and CHAD domain-containing protein [Methylobacterium sp. Leaf100]KQP35050.1 metal-chelation protein CHAD [Methylobacterium sp. Leaf100]